MAVGIHCRSQGTYIIGEDPTGRALLRARQRTSHFPTSALLLPTLNINTSQVQLETTHAISLALPPAITAASASSSATKVLALIETEESKYQESLGDVYQEMGEKTFKALRRALPMTRSKLDWDKVRRRCAGEFCGRLLIIVCAWDVGAWVQIGCGVNDGEQGNVWGCLKAGCFGGGVWIKGEAVYMTSVKLSSNLRSRAGDVAVSTQYSS